MLRYIPIDKKQAICIIVALILTSVFACTCFGLAREMHGSLGYVSDEKWYVCATRNILREVFNVQPSYVDSEGRHHYTVFFRGWNDRASSLKVSGSVTLYEDVGYEGEWITFTEDIRSLVPVCKAKENFVNFVERELGGKIIAHDGGNLYKKTAGVSIATPKKLDYENLFETFPQIKIIQSGYVYHPDTDDRLRTYLNTEHPPLAKYFIGLSMLFLGDEPLNWKIPSIVAGSLTILFVYLIVARLLKNEIVALIVFPIAFTDPILKAMSSVAMLDIYVAFFSALSAWLALRRNYLLSGIFIGFAASCKLSGAFLTLALFSFMAIFQRAGVKKSAFHALVVPLSVWLAFNSPFMIYQGPQPWIEGVMGSLSWHTSPRPPGAPVSTPWGWFVNENPFALHLSPDLFASVNPTTYIAALIALIFVPYLAIKDRDYLVPGLWFGFTFFLFLLVYALGNRTQYSYYAITLSPMVYVMSSVLAYYIALNTWTCFKLLRVLLAGGKLKWALIQIARNPRSALRELRKIHASSESQRDNPAS